MSKRYKGAILSSTPPTTSTSSASGVWTEQQFMQGVASGSWPALAGAPTIGTATAGALSASVTFTAPTYTGSGITGYTVTSNPGGITGTGASSPITVSGLTAGTAYTFTVTATTAAGQSSASAASNSVTPTAPLYIEDVYSTYLYTGNGSTQTITNGIDLAGKGGLVWLKGRSSGNHILQDTDRGANNYLMTDSTAATQTLPNTNFVFGSNGFSMNNSYLGWNANTNPYASWTFRKQPKFFDVVTYTGNGNGAGQTINHNLGSVPGFIICKSTSATGDWAVCARTGSGTPTNSYATGLSLNSTGAAGYSGSLGNYPTSTTFNTAGIFDNPGNYPNVNGVTYVAYLFAHNAGGFGLSGTDNVISCGSFTTNASGTATVNLGYEPQWVLIKQTNADTYWTVLDNMRGWNMSRYEDQALNPNRSAAEAAGGWGNPTSTGFYIEDQNASAPIIYIAIRRGPMKVPTSGTSVFAPSTSTQTSGALVTSGFPVDAFITATRNASPAGFNSEFYGRLQGGGYYLKTSAADAEAYSGVPAMFQYNTGVAPARFDNQPLTLMFQRAPSFFDEVCYTGGSSPPNTFAHNLGVAPELMIIKSRNNAYSWFVYSQAVGVAPHLRLNTTDAATTGTAYLSAAPDASNFYLNGTALCNNTGDTYVAHLFATCAGVSKVGSYTGTGGFRFIDCGFTAGSRFIMIKRTDAAGDWYVWDSARGINPSGTNDPYLLLNSTAAEVTNTDLVSQFSTGFIVQAGLTAINANGGTYIFLAIA